ncbi:hypothetical protein BGX30_003787 [Mortierella sp. GBA39]|nr:hypothetical protein BGX30_003787 [Mortierella sp. GBA39]
MSAVMATTYDEIFKTRRPQTTAEDKTSSTMIAVPESMSETPATKTSPPTSTPSSATLSIDFSFVALASSTSAIAATAPAIESAASASSYTFLTVALHDFPDFNPSFKFPMPTLPTATASSMTG